jgi:hypothetical protein
VDDEHRAGRVRDHVLIHRPQQHPGESAVAAAGHDQQVRALRLLDQGHGRMPPHHALLDAAGILVVERLLD